MPVKHERLIVVALVAMLHGVAFAAYAMQTEQPAVVLDEMSVSFAQMEASQTEIKSPSKPSPREIEPIPEEKPVVREEVPVAPRQEVSSLPQVEAAPVVSDDEPDYRANYLNNPRPPYPMVARRMGYHGKVVLNVEVLAEGRAGQIQLHTSSGYEILDNAALQTVKSWRFAPARHLGQPVTQWFLVPIKFSLEGSNA